MTPRDPEGSPLFRLPLLVVAALFLWLVVTQWIDEAVERELTVQVRP
jgi:hypothetical protein